MTITSYLEEIEALEPQILEWITEWSQINTHCFNLEGIKKLEEELISHFSPLADTTEVIALQPIETFDAKGHLQTENLGSLLSFKKRPEAEVQILFVGHRDTVYPKGASDRGVSVIEGEKVLGPGVADMKGGLALLLAILQVFEKSEMCHKVGWEVVITPDEELGSPSSAKYLEERAPHFTYGLVFEPALPDGAIVSYRPGSLVYQVVCQGRAAHVGRHPEQGRSAIVAMAHLITRMEKLQDLEANRLLNVGAIEGGTSVNTVAGHAWIGVNFRATTDSALQEMLKESLEISKEVEKRHEVSIQWERRTYRPPKPMTKELEELMERFKASATGLHIDLPFHPTGGVCDGNNLAHAGLPTLDTLGPIGHHLHSEEEYLEYPSLIERAKLTLLFLLALP